METTKSTQVDPAEKPKRRRFRPEFKLKILDEIDRTPEQVGLILRREGLYSSNLVQWKRWRNKMGEGGTKAVHNENAKLKREVDRLKLKLKKAESLIELQKKASEILSLHMEDETNESD
jgi:transposase